MLKSLKLRIHQSTSPESFFGYQDYAVDSVAGARLHWALNDAENEPFGTGCASRFDFWDGKKGHQKGDFWYFGMWFQDSGKMLSLAAAHPGPSRRL